MTKHIPRIAPKAHTDAESLRAIFDQRAHITQKDFARLYLGATQGMLWQYLAGVRPLNIAAATGFARGLGVKIQSFSPTIANQIKEAFAFVSEQRGDIDIRQEDTGEIGALISMFVRSTKTGRTQIFRMARQAEKIQNKQQA